MMSFCKKSVHSFLGFSNSNSFDDGTVNSFHHCQNITSPAGGLTLFSVSCDIQRPVNVIESSVFKSPTSPPPITNTDTTSTAKRDPGGIGFLDDVGGSVDGLMSCTESLGFESSDERRVDDDQIENMKNDELSLRKNTSMMARARLKKTVEKREVKKFPPPLSSLNHNGKPTFFLRSVRKDGRLELTEVKIHRPEVFLTSRQDGRLRLHLIGNEVEDLEEEEEIQEDKQEEVEEERDKGLWFPETSGGGDGFRRCHELVVSHHHHHNHHHNLHGWGQHCVTIR